MVNRGSISRESSRESGFGSTAGSSDRAVGLRPSAPVAPGELVAEKYRIDRMIGFGGMGVVCEGVHLELGAKVALKFVRPEYAHDERVVARFLSEARAAAQLRSEHTCRVMDCGRLATGSPYLVMEYLDGADLRRIIAAQGHMPVEDAVSFALQACAALAEAHARGIVHRDVKPENLFLMQGPDGGALIKVLDFGISKQLGSVQGTRGLTDSSDSMGSPHHMSPEQMIDPSTVDARTDIWSLGVLLYELLTGNLPFKGESVPQVCANVMTATPPSPREINPEIPEGLAAVVLRCLEKNRDARFPDVAALSRNLKDFGGSAASVTAARVGRILRAPRRALVQAAYWRPKNPRHWAVGASRVVLIDDSSVDLERAAQDRGVTAAHGDGFGHVRHFHDREAADEFLRLGEGAIEHS